MNFEELLRNKFDNYESDEKPDWKTFKKIKVKPNYTLLLNMITLFFVLSLIGYNSADKIKVKTLPVVSSQYNIK